MHAEIIHKKPDQTIIYNQEVSIRYLRPPTPPPPGILQSYSKFKFFCFTKLV